MALKFITSTMNGGKTTLLLQTVHSWKARGLAVILLKPWKDTREEDITSRIGATATVDFRLKTHHSFTEKLTEFLATAETAPALIVVDEAQFLTVKQVEELFIYAMTHPVDIFCYGLKTDFLGHAFAGSSRLLELADIEELSVMLCRCGAPARFNARFNPTTGAIISEGPKTLIEGSQEDVIYDPLCGSCFITLGGFTAKG